MFKQICCLKTHYDDIHEFKKIRDLHLIITPRLMLLWCLYCQLRTHFTSFSSVSIVSEQVSTGGEEIFGLFLLVLSFCHVVCDQIGVVCLRFIPCCCCKQSQPCFKKVKIICHTLVFNILTKVASN